MTSVLASVSTLAEARQIAALRPDLIDLKNPVAGALGALPVSDVAAIVRALAGSRPVSATVGDLPMEPGTVLEAAEAMAATGVNYVKIGFFPGGDWNAVLRQLTPLATRGVDLIAVLFADHGPELNWLSALAEAGWKGAMLDTADKSKGSLRRISEPGFLRNFVARCRHHGLLCGLAGSLQAEDIADLAALAPDYLGFRGALCSGTRTAALDSEAALRIIDLVHGNARHLHSL